MRNKENARVIDSMKMPDRIDFESFYRSGQLKIKIKVFENEHFNKLCSSIQQGKC